MVQKGEFCCDKSCDIAIQICDKELKLVKKSCDTNFVVCDIDVCVVYGCYISPNVSVKTCENALERITNSIRSIRNQPILICGDFNGKSHMWGSPVEDNRGRVLAEWISSNDLIVQNVGNEPTFERRGQRSHLDITLTNQKAANYVSN